MNFLFPAFLLAGFSLAIPILIHLFNLRRYKTIYFPNIRFLRNITLNSRKQSQIRYKWLLAARLLFLAFLILAFAQPFFPGAKKEGTGNKLKVIYFDNSFSMSVKNGTRSLLEVARDAAAKQLKHVAPGSRFIILTNDPLKDFHALTADKALAAVFAVDFSPSFSTTAQILSTVQSIVENDGLGGADLYYYSDFQKCSFPGIPEKQLLKGVHFYGIPLKPQVVSDVYIDTAYLTAPVLETGKSNFVVAHTKLSGTAPTENPVISLSINGQVKSATTVDFAGKQGGESVDTLNFQVNDANWQHMQLTLNDASLRFDDTFRISARSSPGLTILSLNEGQPNAYIEASFRAYNGFRLNQQPVSADASLWKNYNLVILNGVTHIDAQLGHAISDALAGGQTILIFPGRTNNIGLLNQGLKLVGDISIAGIDTAAQAASMVQQGSALVRDLFERIPDNVQLPTANWHYVIQAGLDANQQSVLSFRNGDPFLAQYAPTKGKLYICATASGLESGNFPGSYFFTPFLYEMATQSAGSSVYAATAGSQQPLYLNVANSAKSTVHAYAPGMDIIPPQKPDGPGLDVFLGEAVQQPGFYGLCPPGADTIPVALNQDKRESQLEYQDIDALKKHWQGAGVSWLNITDTGAIRETAALLPPWKVCVLLAVLMLVVETLVLAQRKAANG